MAFIQAINDTPDASFVSAMGSRLDVDRFLTHVAIENALAEGDGIVGDQGLNNFYLYEYGAKNRFVFIPWDKDNTFRSGTWPLYRNLETNVLTRRLTADPAKRQVYADAVLRAATLVRQPPLAHPAARDRLPADPVGGAGRHPQALHERAVRGRGGRRAGRDRRARERRPRPEIGRKRECSVRKRDAPESGRTPDSGATREKQTTCGASFHGTLLAGEALRVRRGRVSWGRCSRRARTALAVVLLVPLLEAGCGGGPSTPTPPVGPGAPPGGGGSSQPVGTLTRGPYLQHAETGVTVVWYTEAPTDGRVRWYLDDDTTGEVVSSAGIATRHEAVISPLRPGARYTYRVYSGRGLLAGVAGTVDFSFRAPEPDVLRFVVFGDSGLGSPGQLRGREGDRRGGGGARPRHDRGRRHLAAGRRRVLRPALLRALPDAPAARSRSTPRSGNHDYEVLAGKALPRRLHPAPTTAPPASRPSRPTGSSGRGCR